jgi:hypothetical protein
MDAELAALGARVKIAELEAQIAELRRRFPGAARGNVAVSASVRTAPVRRKRRRNMSAKARAEVSARMKKYWAERRKKKGQA